MSKNNDRIYIKDLMESENRSETTIHRWKREKLIPSGHKETRVGAASRLYWHRKELENVEIYGRKLNV